MTPYFTYKKSENIIPHAPGCRTSMIVYDKNNDFQCIVGIENGRFKCDDTETYSPIDEHAIIEFVQCGPTSEYIGFVSKQIEVYISDSRLTQKDNYRVEDIFIGLDENNKYKFTIHHKDPQDLAASPSALSENKRFLGTGVYNHDKRCFVVYQPNYIHKLELPDDWGRNRRELLMQTATSLRNNEN